MVPGDVITSVDGQPITTPNSLTGITAKYHPGDIVSVIWVSLERHRAHDADDARARARPVKQAARTVRRRLSQARRRDSHSAILLISTYSPAVCAISEMPGP